MENEPPASTAGTSGAGAPAGAAGFGAATSAGAHSVAGSGSAGSAGSPGAGSAGASQWGGGGESANAGSAGVASGGAATGGSAGNASNAGRGGWQATGGIGGNGGTGGSGSSSGGPPASCNLASPVSFQKNIQGFLFKSCGKSVSGGCHVTDSDGTKLGYNHAYDWITAFAHTGSCGKSPPYAKRFEVILDLLQGAKPASCPNSRVMPPPGTGAPPTACELAALKAWLAEPLVLQNHVTVSDDTAPLYPNGPYLMPPFN